jgi:hypothetical protein
LAGLATLFIAGSVEAAPVKMVDAADLGVGSHKYYGQEIEVRGARCYYADVGDYRCMTGSSVVVFSPSIANELGKLLVEEHCGEIKLMKGPRCVFSLRFKYSADDVEQDLISGYQRRTIITPETVELVVPKSAAKR